MQKYPAYKDSGVEWLGEIPKDWKSERLASILNNVAERNRTDLPLLSITRERGVILRDLDNEEENHNFIPDDLTNYKVLRKGQFGMNKMKAWQGSYGISAQDGIVSPAYFIFQLRDDLDSRYFHLAIRSRLYVSFFGSASDGVRIGQWDLSRDRMKNIPFLIPPIEEQTAIADFLDRKTALIDQAIGIKHKQIELLKERRQILIHKSVTRGLNPNVKMKDSGVEWIGEIPQGWGVKKMKYLGNIKYGLGQPPKEKENGLPLIRATNVERGKIVEKGLIYVDPDDIPWERDPMLNENDIIIVRSGAYTADSAIITKKYVGSIAGYDMVFTPKAVYPSFISFALLAKYILFDQLYLVRMRAAQPHLNAEELGETLVLCPSLSEQVSISEQIELVSQKIFTAISLTEQEIEKLKEYKATLINSAVTGKIKVC